tara:strand:+ start:1517 stop:11284 length:9768 start_codon:yes stop_codon:yes gene_type:complete
VAIPQQQIPQQQVNQQQQQWQPTYDAKRTRELIKAYDRTPQRFQEQQLDELRNHAMYHNVPFYEGDFSILEALQQAGGGFIEGFTTLRIADPPDNEYEAVARNIGHLAGFVPGILSSPLKALGVMKAAQRGSQLARTAVGLTQLKSIPMLAADKITKLAKKNIVRPVLQGARNSRWKAADEASKFFLKDKAAHIMEGAFHLGAASAVSSVWDGVDQMMHSFMGGAAAGGVFRIIGNVVPGTTTGDKFIKGLAGSLFMGLPTTARGATTPEQIYEYLAGAYFGSKEMPWFKMQAVNNMKEFRKAMRKDPKLDNERQVKDWERFEEFPEIVRKEMVELGKIEHGTRKSNLAQAELLMDLHGIKDQIPKENLTTDGYKALSAIRRGIQKRTKYKADDTLGVALSGGAKGADRLWSTVLSKKGFATIHMMPETTAHRKTIPEFFEALKKGNVKGVDRGVSSKELLEAGSALEEANRTLKRGEITKYGDWAYELIARNYFQIKGANSVYAVAELEGNKRTVKGGTGWAVQMALDKGLQEVYVYHPPEKSWFRWTPEVNRFKAINYTPKLRRNPAVIGSREIRAGSPEHKAMIAVADATFGKKKTPTKDKGLTEEETKLMHQRTLENVGELNRQIDKKKLLLKDVRADLKDASLGKVRTRELAQQEKELSKEIDDIYKDIQFKHKGLESTQYIDMTSGIIINDIDTGSTPQNNTLMKKGEMFSNNHLKELWDKDGVGQSKRNSMLDMGKVVDTIVRKYSKKGDKNVNIDQAVKVMERVFSTNNKKFELSEKGKLELRKWIREANLGKQVIKIKTTGGANEAPGFTNPNRPTTATGMSIRQVESPKILEEVYLNEGGKLEKGASKSPIVIFDTVARKSKRNFTIDVPLNRLAKHLQFNEIDPITKRRYTEEDAEKAADNIIGDIIRKVYKSDNLYPFGGQGDKGRIVFAKLHPALKGENTTGIKLQYRQLINAIRRGTKDKNILANLNSEKKRMEFWYGVKPEDFERMVVSNMRYDLSLNGYKFTPENINKIMGDGFIGSAVAFNKRHQIWMTNGYGGSKDFIKNAVDKKGKIILDDLSPRGNVKYMLVDDPLLPDALKKSVLKARSTQLGEDQDGAILVRDDYIDVINKDAGHPASGQQKSFIVDNTPEYTAKGEVNKGALLGKYMMHSVGPEATQQMKDAGVHMIVYKSAAKQTGERLIGDYNVKEGQLRTFRTEEQIEAEWDVFINNMVYSPTAKKNVRRIDIPNFDPYRSRAEFAAAKGYTYDKKTDSFKPLNVVQQGGLEFTGGKIYELNPESVKYSTSVIQDPHMEQKQVLVKQLFTNIHQFASTPIDKYTIEDIFQETIKKNFDGNEVYNKVLEEYRLTKSEDKIDFLVENLEELSTPKLIKTLKTPGAERFAELALQRMLRIVEKDIEMSFQDGETTAEQRAERIRQFTEAVSPIDRLLKNSAIVGEEANAAGETGYPAFMHKFVRDYKASVLHNYFVKSVTRPKIENSLLARMRPYDKWMQKDFKELDTNDTIFYLDDAYRNTKIRLDNGKYKELGKLWDKEQNNPDFAKYFNALVLRVPMDSISGAHKLQFKGFTGRKGHGIMLNSKTMRALGGADLDGDEAFVYLGGKNKDNSGYGMKEAWLNAIDANKNEYYNKAQTHVEDNKNAVIQHGPYKGQTFAQVLTVGAGKGNPLKESKALYYSPLARIMASQGAVKGRDMLGLAVSQSQVMKSTFNALMEADGKKDVFTVFKRGKNGGTFRVTVTPKFGKKDLAYQREMVRAQTAFASDPMDEAGLREPSHFFKTMYDSYFNVKFEKYNPKSKKYFKLDKEPKNWSQGDYYGDRSDYNKAPSLLGAFKNMNSAYFGRNWSEGRNYSMDEVNHLASDIGMLSEKQKNTILPKIVDTLEGLDWSDNLFRRVDRGAIEQTYAEINDIVTDKKGKFGNWLKDAMNRSTFTVTYNEHIKANLAHELHDPAVRRKIALRDDPASLKEFLNIVKHSVWGKEFEGYGGKEARLAKLYTYKERLSILEQMNRQAEDFLSNDVATMATIKSVKRILEKERMPIKDLKSISNAVAKFKARSYLSRKERVQLDYDAIAGTAKDKEHIEFVNALLGIKKNLQDIQGDKRSTVWDQKQLDAKIRQYKDGLKNDAQRELFDHLFIGTLDRGDMSKVNRLIKALPQKKASPVFRELMNKIIKETSRTTQSRLAFNSEEISPIAIQNHLKSMNNVFNKIWTPLDKPTFKATTMGVENVLDRNPINEQNLADDLVMSAHKGEGYAGIKKGEVNAEDKAVITEIATILKRYNNKLGNNIPDLNEQMRGISAEVDPEGMGKDLNTFTKQDFVQVRNFLREAESGTWFQNLRKNPTPDIMKRYYGMFPTTVNRELMAYDIKWLKQKQWYLTKSGRIKEGYVRRPTYFLEMLMNQAHEANSLAIGKAEVLAKDIENQFVNISELKEGNALFQIAVGQAELGMKQSIDKRRNLESDMKEHYKLNYDESRAATEKEFNWPKLKDKEFTLLNDNNKRIQATGQEIVNGNKEKSLTGIKNKVAQRFESLFPLMAGDGTSINRYKTGKYFDANKTQPRMNWKLFVEDMTKSLERGDDIPINLGIDGMRNIQRSMMYDLAKTPEQKATYKSWKIKATRPMDYTYYWPHMFFDKRTSELNVKRTLDFIRNNPNLNEKQKKSRIQSLLMRHNTITGEWEFQNIQDFDKVDVIEITEGLKDIAKKRGKATETVKWTDMNTSFGSMMQREGHVGGWSKDLSVMNAYVRNLTSTYFKQMNQIMSRKTIHDAKERMTKKFGNKLASKWEKYFKLYVQGAMGQPDVIPKKWYDDPDMKLKGTPYAWFADSTVLDRVNKVREKLGIRESDLPKELKDFTFQDIKHWSNMEAKFELASLLAHPKSAVTNIFGGSLHTIQSAGHGAFMKARDMKYLKRINPNFNSLQDVENWVVKKGVVPEFMIHELGLGQDATTKRSIESFIGELSSKINSKEPIERKEVLSLGKKYKLSDRMMSVASKFMSIPERTLRRDAFMAHYIRAWERFGGAITDPEHPFLIEMGKKGVKATQFLYEAPQRPMFARTALGKVMSRFQLYAWNSTRFRNDIIREAARYGFKPGTSAYEKFERTMTIDLLVLALGNMFMYSLFDNALPQPLSWFQDTADWLFGNERDRERAFFGVLPTAIAPLQMITPPITRFPIAGIMEWAKDDYTKFSDYQVYTMFPFGRIVRDLVQPGKGLIENPSRLLEKMAGMPLRDLQKFSTERKKKIEEGVRYNQPKVGF